MDPRNLGRLGERVAEKFLKKKGYQILSRNFKRKWGELDLVGKKKGKIIFFEVKTSLEKEGFSPENKINRKKKSQLCKISRLYLSENKFPTETPSQIDIIAITISPNHRIRIRHYQNALEDNYY